MSILRATIDGDKFKFKDLYGLGKVLGELQGQEVDVKITPAVKSSEKQRMYAYYQAVVLPLTIRALTKDGYELVDEYAADHYLKATCAKAILYNTHDDAEMAYVLEKRAMNKERLVKFIGDCVWLLEERHEIVCPDGGVYKMLRTTGSIGNFKKQR